MAPTRKSSDAGSASKPQRSRDFLSISEKVRILDMIEIEKKEIVRGNCQVVCQERIFLSRSDEE
jgi:predicted Ser/Thr protein kinase